MAEKKKKIVIYNNGITMDGQITILMNILKNLDSSKYDIILLILADFGKENVSLPLLPDHVKINFLPLASLINKFYYYKGIKRNLFKKLYYNYLIWRLATESRKQCVKYINEIRKQNGEIDVFIDFDGGTRRYIDKIKSNQKINFL